MAETEAPLVTQTAPAPGSDAAASPATPIVTESASAPTAEATPTVVTVADPAKPAATVVTKTEGVTDAPIPAENILGDAKLVAETPEIKKTDEATKPEGEKPADKEAKTEPKESPKPSEGEKSIAPIYEFKLPENIQVDKEPLENFSKLLGEIESGKLDHNAYQAKGQALVDMHIKAVQDTLQRQTDHYLNFHKQQGDEWLNAFKKDPELGGSNIAETVASLQDVVGRFGGNEVQLAEFRDIMKNTNVGNHPAVIRFIKNMADKINKYESEPQNGMVPAAKPAPVKVKAHQLFYGN